MNEEMVKMEERAGEPAEERSVELITQEILFYKRQAAGAFLEIGRRLNEAKGMLRHGEWLPWLREKVDISERLAQDFMRLYKEYGKSAEIADLGASKALALLALPVSEREEFAAETHLVNGEEKTVKEMTSRELKQAILERDRARAEVRTAEEARAVMERDMELVKERMEGLNREAAEKARKVRDLEMELKELRERPIEVAVQDAAPEQLEQARMEGAEEARARAAGELSQARSELEELRERERRAGEKAAELEKKLEEAGRQAEELARQAEREREEAQRLAREAERSKENTDGAGEDLAAFKVLFRQTQEMVNQMDETLKRMEGAGKTEETGKLRRALAALAGAIERVAEG